MFIQPGAADLEQVCDFGDCIPHFHQVLCFDDEVRRKGLRSADAFSMALRAPSLCSLTQNSEQLSNLCL